MSSLTRIVSPFAGIAVALSLASCADESGANGPEDVDAGTDILETDTSNDTSMPDTENLDMTWTVASCWTPNVLTGDDECLLYDASDWSPEAAAAHCAGFPAVSATRFEPDVACPVDETLGACAASGPDGTPFVKVFAGTDPTACALARTDCEAYADGVFDPAPRCAPDVAPLPELPGPGVFVPAYLDCRPSDDPDQPGMSEDGSVCTNTIISACTEPGRRYEEYASCDVVRTQRPYYPFRREVETDPEDPRLDDEEYLGEVAWIAEQVEACACTCCHSESGAPAGTSDWYIDAGPLWIDTVSDSGLAMFGGYIDSNSLGVMPAEENFGFDRIETGLPTTDTERLQRFILAELERRGISADEAEAYPAFGGPFGAQDAFEPRACTGTDGFGDDGTLRWPGNARYVYVLETTAANPGVPPSRDLPDGTLWRLDVPAGQPALRSGIPYGEVPEGAFQRVPFNAPAPELEAGKEYYIYVLADILLPVLRCYDTWPG